MPTTILDGETYEQARNRRFTEEAKVIEKIQQDEIIRMAREASIETLHIKRDGEKHSILDLCYPELERFAAIVAAHEREACAKVCEEVGPKDGSLKLITEGFAAAIRARGEK